jgi:hypothetical protein
MLGRPLMRTITADQQTTADQLSYAAKKFEEKALHSSLDGYDMMMLAAANLRFIRARVLEDPSMVAEARGWVEAAETVLS